MIYLDNNATTQPDPQVVEAMLPWIGSQYGNPSTGYRFGKLARQAIEEARQKVADLIDAEPAEIVFTSGGTESNNTALNSAMHLWPDRSQLLTSRVEHSAVYEWVNRSDAPWQPCLTEVDSNGQLDLESWQRALASGTAFAALIWANNETGVLSPIVEAAECAKQAGVYFHTDAVQAVGKIRLSVNDAPIHSLAISAHKFHGPKGVGALYINKYTRFKQLVVGGGQERERRSGTENVAAIVGMGVAADLASARIEQNQSAAIAKRRDQFERGVIEAVEGVEINGSIDNRIANTTNLYFPKVDGEGLLILLDEAGLCCSPGSACSTGSVQPSRILKAMGHSSDRARSSVRFSLSHMTTNEEIDHSIKLVKIAVGKLKL